MPYTVYILYSGTINKFYIGYTGNAVTERLRKHNSNHKGFTGKVPDWQAVHLETFDSKLQAANREKQIKAWKSRKMIENLVGIK